MAQEGAGSRLMAALHASMEKTASTMRLVRALNKKPQARGDGDIQALMEATHGCPLLTMHGAEVHSDLCHVLKHRRVAPKTQVRLPADWGVPGGAVFVLVLSGRLLVHTANREPFDPPPNRALLTQSSSLGQSFGRDGSGNNTGAGAGGGGGGGLVFSDEELLEVFRSIDTDASGAIDVHEMAIAFDKMGIHKTAAEVTELLEGVDEDGSGELEFDEFKEVLSAALGLGLGNRDGQWEPITGDLARSAQQQLDASLGGGTTAATIAPPSAAAAAPLASGSSTAAAAAAAVAAIPALAPAPSISKTSGGAAAPANSTVPPSAIPRGPLVPQSSSSSSLVVRAGSGGAGSTTADPPAWWAKEYRAGSTLGEGGMMLASTVASNPPAPLAGLTFAPDTTAVVSAVMDSASNSGNAGGAGAGGLQTRMSGVLPLDAVRTSTLTTSGSTLVRASSTAAALVPAAGNVGMGGVVLAGTGGGAGAAALNRSSLMGPGAVAGLLEPLSHEGCDLLVLELPDYLHVLENGFDGELKAKVGLLRSAPALRGSLVSSPLRAVAFASSRMVLGPGKPLYLQGQPADAFYLLVKGECRVSVNVPTAPDSSSGSPQVSVSGSGGGAGAAAGVGEESSEYGIESGGAGKGGSGGGGTGGGGGGGVTSPRASVSLPGTVSSPRGSSSPRAAAAASPASPASPFGGPMAPRSSRDALLRRAAGNKKGGRKQDIAVLGPGDLCGEAAVMGLDVHATSVTVSSLEAVILRIERSALDLLNPSDLSSLRNSCISRDLERQSRLANTLGISWYLPPLETSNFLTNSTTVEEVQGGGCATTTKGAGFVKSLPKLKIPGAKRAGSFSPATTPKAGNGALAGGPGGGDDSSDNEGRRQSNANDSPDSGAGFKKPGVKRSTTAGSLLLGRPKLSLNIGSSKKTEGATSPSSLTSVESFAGRKGSTRGWGSEVQSPSGGSAPRGGNRLLSMASTSGTAFARSFTAAGTSDQYGTGSFIKRGREHPLISLRGPVAGVSGGGLLATRNSFTSSPRQSAAEWMDQLMGRMSNRPGTAQGAVQGAHGTASVALSDQQEFAQAVEVFMKTAGPGAGTTLSVGIPTVPPFPAEAPTSTPESFGPSATQVGAPPPFLAPPQPLRSMPMYRGSLSGTGVSYLYRESSTGLVTHQGSVTQPSRFALASMGSSTLSPHGSTADGLLGRSTLQGPARKSLVYDSTSFPAAAAASSSRPLSSSLLVDQDSSNVTVSVGPEDSTHGNRKSQTPTSDADHHHHHLAPVSPFVTAQTSMRKRRAQADGNREDEGSSEEEGEEEGEDFLLEQDSVPLLDHDGGKEGGGVTSTAAAGGGTLTEAAACSAATAPRDGGVVGTAGQEGTAHAQADTMGGDGAAAAAAAAAAEANRADGTALTSQRSVLDGLYPQTSTTGTLPLTRTSTTWEGGHASYGIAPSSYTSPQQTWQAAQQHSATPVVPPVTALSALDVSTAARVSVLAPHTYNYFASRAATAGDSQPHHAEHSGSSGSSKLMHRHGDLSMLLAGLDGGPQSVREMEEAAHAREVMAQEMSEIQGVTCDVTSGAALRRLSAPASVLLNVLQASEAALQQPSPAALQSESLHVIPTSPSSGYFPVTLSASYLNTPHAPLSATTPLRTASGMFLDHLSTPPSQFFQSPLAGNAPSAPHHQQQHPLQLPPSGASAPNLGTSMMSAQRACTTAPYASHSAAMPSTGHTRRSGAAAHSIGSKGRSRNRGPDGDADGDLAALLASSGCLPADRVSHFGIPHSSRLHLIPGSGHGIGLEGISPPRTSRHRGKVTSDDEWDQARQRSGTHAFSLFTDRSVTWHEGTGDPLGTESSTTSSTPGCSASGTAAGSRGTTSGTQAVQGRTQQRPHIPKLNLNALMAQALPASHTSSTARSSSKATQPSLKHPMSDRSHSTSLQTCNRSHLSTDRSHLNTNRGHAQGRPAQLAPNVVNNGRSGSGSSQHSIEAHAAPPTTTTAPGSDVTLLSSPHSCPSLSERTASGDAWLQAFGLHGLSSISATCATPPATATAPLQSSRSSATAAGVARACDFSGSNITSAEPSSAMLWPEWSTAGAGFDAREGHHHRNSLQAQKLSPAKCIAGSTRDGINEGNSTGITHSDSEQPQSLAASYQAEVTGQWVVVPFVKDRRAPGSLTAVNSSGSLHSRRSNNTPREHSGQQQQRQHPQHNTPHHADYRASGATPIPATPPSLALQHGAPPRWNSEALRQALQSAGGDQKVLAATYTRMLRDDSVFLGKKSLTALHASQASQTGAAAGGSAVRNRAATAAGALKVSAADADAATSIAGLGSAAGLGSPTAGVQGDISSVYVPKETALPMQPVHHSRAAGMHDVETHQPPPLQPQPPPSQPPPPYAATLQPAQPIYPQLVRSVSRQFSCQRSRGGGHTLSTGVQNASAGSQLDGVTPPAGRSKSGLPLDVTQEGEEEQEGYGSSSSSDEESGLESKDESQSRIKQTRGLESAAKASFGTAVPTKGVAGASQHTAMMVNHQKLLPNLSLQRMRSLTSRS